MRLLETFADQAVIAIENVRLFTELQEKNRALENSHAQITEALEQQTATSEILRVIARSPTDLQPVLDAMAESAARLCAAYDASILRLDGNVLRSAAHYGPIPTNSPGLPVPVIRGTVNGRAVLDRQAVQVADLQAEVEEFPEGSMFARELGHRTLLSVPLLREGNAIGTIGVRRTEVQPFTDTQVALLETFADQAVIAIENVRLFTELQEKNRALAEAHANVTEALEQQTATAEILRVIASSPTDLQPVMEAVAENAARVLRGDGFVDLPSRRGASARWWRGMDRCVGHWRSETPSRQSRHRRRTGCARPADDPRRGHHGGRGGVPGHRVPPSGRPGPLSRTMLATPLLREGTPLGVIFISRGPEVHPFSAKQIALLETFADQAVIAIENVRLFKELRGADGRADALGGAAHGARRRRPGAQLDARPRHGARRPSSTRASQLAGTDGCTIFEYDEAAEEFRLRASRYADPQEAATLDAIGRATPIPKGQGRRRPRGRDRGSPSRSPTSPSEGAYESPIRGAARRGRLSRAPRRAPAPGGAGHRRPGRQPQDARRRSRRRSCALLTTFATQSALAIQNARLFREIADKSRQLEAASRHKSEFLANMSHELRTPLNAILGFSEVLAERMFGEVNEKQAEYLQDILSSGRHLLSLINDILDLSKVEAGRLELELGRFHLPTALDNALTLVRERATRHGITLTQTVDERLGDIVADERKVKQILLNLLSNAVKFTPEGGRVGLTATAADGVVTIAVSDTGVGIAPEDQAAIFEEFRQVGRGRHPQAGGHGARADARQEVRGAARGTDLGREPGGPGVDVQLHAARSA